MLLSVRLCGFPPFSEDENGLESVYLKIRSGALDFPHPYWTNVSDGGMFSFQCFGLDRSDVCLTRICVSLNSQGLDPQPAQRVTTGSLQRNSGAEPPLDKGRVQRAAAFVGYHGDEALQPEASFQLVPCALSPVTAAGKTKTEDKSKRVAARRTSSGCWGRKHRRISWWSCPLRPTHLPYIHRNDMPRLEYMFLTKQRSRQY